MKEWINYEEYWDYRMKTQPLDPELESRRLMNEEYESIMSFLHEKYSKTYPNISTEELKQILNEQY
ncbi:hypothetical protein HOE22_03845 [Candidatus Woesearchaeota archaeon]|jgi:hypothetical protein|nr:hypothetical protein [Candidatus Woesearchaeota archaeon]MBT5212773.1 hypothetical protein [Candidatus Neomarinimicrobiota bacterium]